MVHMATDHTNPVRTLPVLWRGNPLDVLGAIALAPSFVETLMQSALDGRLSIHLGVTIRDGEMESVSFAGTPATPSEKTAPRGTWELLDAIELLEVAERERDEALRQVECWKDHAADLFDDWQDSKAEVERLNSSWRSDVEEGLRSARAENERLQRASPRPAITPAELSSAMQGAWNEWVADTGAAPDGFSLVPSFEGTVDHPILFAMGFTDSPRRVEFDADTAHNWCRMVLDRLSKS